MRVIQTRAEVGDDRVLRVRLPEDVPTGALEVLLVMEPVQRPPGLQERRAAAHAGVGALSHIEISTEEFQAERLADEVRREKALGE
jgi:hypothetical protein